MVRQSAFQPKLQRRFSVLPFAFPFVLLIVVFYISLSIQCVGNASFVILVKIWQCSVGFSSLHTFRVVSCPTDKSLWNVCYFIGTPNDAWAFSVNNVVKHFTNIFMSGKYRHLIATTIRMPARPLERLWINSFQIIANVGARMVVA